MFDAAMATSCCSMERSSWHQPAAGAARRQPASKRELLLFPTIINCTFQLLTTSSLTTPDSQDLGALCRDSSSCLVACIQ